MNSLQFRPSRLLAASTIAIGLAFGAMGTFCLVSPARSSIQQLGGYCFLLCCAFLVAVGIRRLLDTRPQLVVDEHGLFDRTLGVGVIPWSEITNARVRRMRGNAFVCLSLRRPEVWLHKLSPVRRILARSSKILGFAELSINVSAVGGNAGQVHELILTFIAHYRGRA